MKLLALGIFVLTYALIVSRRLRWLPSGRSAGALLEGALERCELGFWGHLSFGAASTLR